MIDGAVVFELKATHGVPFDIVFERVLIQENQLIDWVAFIEAARGNGWWDFQIYEATITGLADAGVDRKIRLGIQQRMCIYMLHNRHPGMK